MGRPDEVSSADTDAVLATAASGGDRRALELLLERHADRIHRLCARIVRDPSDTLDAAQETMIAVARGIDRFDGRSAFTTWLYRVATNAAIEETRRRGRRPVPTEEPLDVPAPSPGPESAATSRIDVEHALERVPDDFRAALVLRDMEELDYSEIAAVLDVPIGTVRSRIARGRRALATLLGNYSRDGDVQQGTHHD
ncbi:MAG: sigma-70 family RNA polymerase sigma factor [Acidimicrobiia bacterium]